MFKPTHINALSNQIALILKCVNSVTLNVVLLYYRLLNNSIIYVSVLFRIKAFLVTFITPLLNIYAILLTRNSVDTR